MFRKASGQRWHHDAADPTHQEIGMDLGPSCQKAIVSVDRSATVQQAAALMREEITVQA